MESIGGYRIIRKLGSGSRADVFLGHAEHTQEAADQLAAIKLFRADVAPDGIAAEIAALSSIDSSHVVRLLDLASGADGSPCLILQRLEPGGLGQLLTRRDTLSAGEAVTIVAPIADAVHVLHTHGIVHGKVSASAVLFDRTGAPILTKFGAVGFIAGGERELTPADLDADAGVADDLNGLRVLVDSVVSRVGDAGGPIEAFLHWVRTSDGAASQFTAELTERLFTLAEPVPVDFDADSTGQAALPHRWAADSALAAGTAPETVMAGHGGDGAQALWFPRLPAPIAGLLEQALESIQQRIGSLRATAGTVRGRSWALAGIGAAAIIAAIVLVPIGNDDEPPAVRAEPAPTTTEPAVKSAASGDDPLAAAAELLRIRAACLRDRSVLCLDAVDQAGSTAWEADARRIHELQQGAELAVETIAADATPTLVERLGDLALLALAPGDAEGTGVDTAQPGTADQKEPASVLMVRTEAGWRFRSLAVGDGRVADQVCC